MDAYVDKEDYFDKYFQMDTILIFFFYKYITLVLNSLPLVSLILFSLCSSTIYNSVEQNPLLSDSICQL